MDLPDLSKEEGRAVAQDALLERGWKVEGQLSLESLWGACDAAALHELACRYAERALPLFAEHYPGDERARAAIDAKRGWLRGEVREDDLVQADRDLRSTRVGDGGWCAAWAADVDGSTSAKNQFHTGCANDSDEARAACLALTVAYMLGDGKPPVDQSL